MIAVTFALSSESSAFIRLLQNPTSARHSHVTWGTLNGHAVCVLLTGVGEKAVRARLPEFLNQHTPRLLISSGFAGALGEQLQVGDLFLPTNYSTPMLPNLQCFSGILATMPSVIDSAEERQELARAKGAEAVDMETQFIADACATAGIPMLSLRVISDTPTAPLPAPPYILFDIERQQTPYVRLFAYLGGNPSAVGRLLSFARQIATARQSLTHALDLLFRSGAV